jgi:hypothetical protein
MLRVEPLLCSNSETDSHGNKSTPSLRGTVRNGVFYMVRASITRTQVELQSLIRESVKRRLSRCS